MTDNVIKLPPIPENKFDDAEVTKHLYSIIGITEAYSLLAMIMDKDGDIKIISGLGSKHPKLAIRSGTGLSIPLADLKAMSLQLTNLVSVLEVHKLIN